MIEETTVNSGEESVSDPPVISNEDSREENTVDSGSEDKVQEEPPATIPEEKQEDSPPSVTVPEPPTDERNTGEVTDTPSGDSNIPPTTSDTESESLPKAQEEPVPEPPLSSNESDSSPQEVPEEPKVQPQVPPSEPDTSENGNTQEGETDQSPPSDTNDDQSPPKEKEEGEQQPPTSDTQTDPAPEPPHSVPNGNGSQEVPDPPEPQEEPVPEVPKEDDKYLVESDDYEVLDKHIKIEEVPDKDKPNENIHINDSNILRININGYIDVMNMNRVKTVYELNTKRKVFTMKATDNSAMINVTSDNTSKTTSLHDRLDDLIRIHFNLGYKTKRTFWFILDLDINNYRIIVSIKGGKGIEIFRLGSLVMSLGNNPDLYADYSIRDAVTIALVEKIKPKEIYDDENITLESDELRPDNGSDEENLT